MAMGQQRAIHPFFQKDHGALSKSAPEPSTDDVISHDSAHHEGRPSDSEAVPDTPPVAMLEHDPNSGRRKRRKTKEPADAGVIKNSPNGAPDEDSQPPGQIPGVAPHTPTAETAGQTQDLPSLPSADGDLSALKSQDNPASSNAIPKNSPKRKTLKLNANGKLLSSPNLAEAEGKSNPNARGRPRRSGRKTKNERTWLVIKYANEDGERERIGNLIDDIINGRRKYGLPEPPAVPASTESQPPKPTHPFFLKKPTRKADHCQTADASQNHESLDPTAEKLPEDTQKGQSADRHKPSLDSPAPQKSFPSFKPRPKFPEPIEPLWPPRDFVHVRGFDSKDSHRGNDPDTLDTDQKKAKMAVIRVDDQENVLKSSNPDAEHPQNCQPGKALRIPGRQVASGKVLQRAVSRQLSESSGTNANDSGTSRGYHPAIKRLSSYIPTSMTAFDQGEFESSLWAHKYMPNSAEEVLQPGREPLMLRDWLKYLMVSAVDTGKRPKDQAAKQKEDKKKRAKRRKKAEELDDFVASSGSEQFEMGELSSDEDELAGDVTVSSKRTLIRSGDLGISRADGARGRLSNAILLSGPSGCGKTASVYAVAKELDFEVFEINPGSRRSSRDLLERVGDMTRNHLVHNLNAREDQSRPNSPGGSEEGKQNKMGSFFKSVSGKPKPKEMDLEPDPKQIRTQKQSLILLEEADLLFEEDKQFWSGVMTLISQSKRPIIITCNDESLIPLEDISLHAILRYRTPPQDLAVDYLVLVAANEGHMVRREAIRDLHAVYRKDLRKAITDLSFWCQMGIGSEKSGLDWIIDRWPQGSDLDSQGDPLRVISLNTYHRFMGWFNRDMMLGNTLDSAIESSLESLHWWHLGIQDSESMTNSSRLSRDSELGSLPKLDNESLNALRRASEYEDMRSDLDMLCSSCADLEKDTIDMSTPRISEKHRASYIEGYPMLQADPEPDYTFLSASIGSTFEILMRRASGTASHLDAETSQALRVLANATQPSHSGPSAADALSAFEPVMQANYVFPLPTGRLAPSFENGSGALFEDLAPYIRAIVAFDARLEKYRLQLSGLHSQGSTGSKRTRTTRASRAALEGGNKLHTRKERWFPPDTNPARVLATGNQEWQDLLVQRGYFSLGIGERGETENNSSESSGEGGT